MLEKFSYAVMVLCVAGTSFRHKLCFNFRVMRRTVLIIVFFFLCYLPVGAVDYLDVSCSVADALNQMRRSPVSFAESNFGVKESDLEKIWSGWFFDDLARGEFSLKCDPRLYRVARKAAAGILTQQDLNYPNVYTLEYMASEEGFAPFMLTKVVSVLFFENLVPEDKALTLLLEHLLKSAILRKNTQSEALLYPLYNSLGAVMASDSFEADGHLYNGYLLVLVLGVEREDVSGYIVAGWGYKPGYHEIFSWEDRFERKPVVFGDGSYLLKAEPDTYLLKDDGNVFAFTLIKPVRLDFIQ